MSENSKTHSIKASTPKKTRKKLEKNTKKSRKFMKNHKIDSLHTSKASARFQSWTGISQDRKKIH